MVANGEAPSPYYAAIGVVDAAGSLPRTLGSAATDPLGSLSGLASAARSPGKQYEALVKRGHVRVVSDGAELAVRAKAPLANDQLAGPARSTAGAVARGRQMVPRLPRRGVRHH